MDPGGGGERGAGGDAGVPPAAFQPAAGDVGLAVAVEITHLHVHPGDVGVPSGPQAIRECCAGRLSHIPLAGLQITADDVRLAVAVEVADLDVCPSHVRIPTAP